jgi:hypothetical protein
VAEPCQRTIVTPPQSTGGPNMHGIIYLVGLVVVILFILSALGLR